MTDVDYYRDVLSDVYGGKRWIVTSDALAGMTGLVGVLDDLDAEACLPVAGSRGAGDPPDPDFAPDPIVLDLEAEDMMAGIRKSMQAFRDLPETAVARIEEFDPEREARVIGPIWDDGSELAGRTKYGARPGEWQALEDKTRIDAFWDDIGVERAASAVRPAEFDALWEASRELDAGSGCAWVGDNREGFHGGASYLRRVRDEDEARDAAEFLAGACDDVRVMPFLEGIPCSIHGLVFPDYTAVFRPCEMLVFRRAGDATLHYGKAATFWDPPDEDRQYMRRLARRVGDALRERLDYRGAFTVDGILTEDGFVPTELNPRFGAAFGLLAGGLRLPMMLLNLVVVEGADVDWHPRDFEEMVLANADENRRGGGIAMVEPRIEETRRMDLVWDDGAFREAGEDEEADASAMLGPSTSGGFLSVGMNSETTPVGPSVAPRVAKALEFLDDYWGLGVGRLIPAKDVRKR